MEVVETVILRNLPQDIKLVESAISVAHGEFRGKNPELNLHTVEIKFIAGTTTKEIKREIK